MSFVAACGDASPVDGAPVADVQEVDVGRDAEPAVDAFEPADSGDEHDAGNEADAAPGDGGPCADSAACPDSVCGNGRLDRGEQCDDFNTTPGDGCSATCQALEEPGEPFLISPPPGATLSGTSQTFMWTSGGSATRLFDFHLGPFLGDNAYHDTDGVGVVRVTTAVDLPTDGSTIYVRLYWTDDEWNTSTFNDFLIRAASL